MKNDFSPTSTSVFSKKLIAIVCVALNFALMFLAFLLAVVSVLMMLTVAPTLYRSDGIQVTLLFGVICLYAILLIIVHFNGFKISVIFGKSVGIFKGHFIKLEVPAWNLFAILSVIVGVEILLSLAISASSVKYSLQNSMHRGMNQYTQDPTWKTVFDNMHQTRECCGVMNYTDWRQTAMLSPEEAKETSSSTDGDSKVDGVVEAPVIPPSCCRPETKGQCLNDRRRKRVLAECSQEALDKMLERIYTDGCFPMLVQTLDTAVASITIVLVIILVLQTVVLLLTLVLFLAARKGIPPPCYQPLPAYDQLDPRRNR